MESRRGHLFNYDISALVVMLVTLLAIVICLIDYIINWLIRGHNRKRKEEESLYVYVDPEPAEDDTCSKPDTQFIFFCLAGQIIRCFVITTTGIYVCSAQLKLILDILYGVLQKGAHSVTD